MTRKDAIFLALAPAKSRRIGAARARTTLTETSRAKLASSLELLNGRELPAGSTGTIVGVWADGEAYEVEFTKPFHAVVTVTAPKLSRVDSEA